MESKKQSQHKSVQHDIDEGSDYGHNSENLKKKKYTMPIDDNTEPLKQKSQSLRQSSLNRAS